MEIAFDEEKIRREKKYDIRKMWAMVDEYLLKDFRLKKTDDGVYCDYPGYDGLPGFMAFGIRFENRSWFAENIKKWDLLEIDDDDPTDILRENWKQELLGVSA